MDYHERENIAEKQGRVLVDLVETHLPIDRQTRGPANAWALVGPALIARQASTLEAIFALRSLEREADPIVLLRSLFDHAVTFAWLAADPGPERHQRFLKSDAKARLKADDDCRKVGEPMLTEENRARFQAQADDLPAEMPDLLQRAEAADEYWTDKLPGIKGSDTTHSFRGLYAIAYRRHSAIDHATLMGLNQVIVDLDDGRQRVQLEERDPELHGPFGLAPVLLALSLFISAATLGWPEVDAIHAAFK